MMKISCYSSLQGNPAILTIGHFIGSRAIYH
jgi:hypothetical protein